MSDFIVVKAAKSASKTPSLSVQLVMPSRILVEIHTGVNMILNQNDLNKIRERYLHLNEHQLRKIIADLLETIEDDEQETIYWKSRHREGKDE